MRYYQIVITNPNTGEIVVPNSLRGAFIDSTYSSLVNGRFLSNALDIELDIFEAPLAQPAGGSYVKIRGVSIEEINNSHDLDNFNISVYGGFSKGLPLANPAQAGLLISGTIYQAFGNWIGTDMSLDLLLYPRIGTAVTPLNIIHDWQKGQQLSVAIAQTLSIALPNYEQNVNISPNLISTEQDVGFYQTLEQYAAYIKQASQAIIGGSYAGVDIYIDGNTINVTDGTVVPAAASAVIKTIDFKDLIGQPTWISSPVIQFKTMMRADIDLFSFITLPQGLITTTVPAAQPGINLRSTFNGIFQVVEARHNGNFRQPDADSWVSIFNAIPVTPVLQ